MLEDGHDTKELLANFVKAKEEIKRLNVLLDSERAEFMRVKTNLREKLNETRF